MIRPIPLPVIARLPATVPFVGPEAIERRTGRPFEARLGANESGFGPSPKVVEAIRAATAEIWKYGDPDTFALKAAIAAHHGIAADNVVAGEGIDGLLGLIVRLFVAPGTPVVASQGAYPTVLFHLAAAGAQHVEVPFDGDREHLDGLLAAIRRSNAPLAYISNPNNPMGTWWPAGEIEAFIAALPPTTLLVLDEAYGETAPEGTLPPLDIARPNVIRTRTFSKAYGLAGMRVGYCLGEAELIRQFEKVRNHFGLGRLAQAAAIAALDDQAWLLSVIDRIAAGRLEIERIAAASGLASVPSATNFVSVDCGRDGAFARRVLDALAGEAIFVRKPATPGLDRCIRISVGTKADLALLDRALPRALVAAASAG